MELASKYNPADIESKWYQYWLDNSFFNSKPDGREPYTIVIPPPNVTGVLHMGHMLNNTIQDVLVRRARMKGKNACWVPGTDHASIATEAKVVAKLAAEGIKKTDLTREAFLEHAWDWTHKHGGIILEQLKKLGASCDWDRTAFTMDEVRSESVIKVFIDLYNKGLIYRGVRMVNWDPKALTALSDEEVIFKELNGKLYYLRYQIEGESGYAVVATTRPETIMGDTAMCINPNDPKNAHLKGKKVLVPLINRPIPVIEDDYVDIEFGTGCLKVTPAHDVNDYVLGEKYNLPAIDIFNNDGTLNEHGAMYAGMDRFEVRTQIVKDLENAGLMDKIEPYTNKVGFSERTDVIIEPKLSMQWFLNMERLAQPALQAVMNDDIKLHPAKFKNTYRHWMENVKDWCISRQLWWGHRLPAYFLPQGGIVVATTIEEALEKARQFVNYPICADDLRQDEDCLDTWFSSWLWPISVFDGINNPDNEDIRYYYPTDDLVTAPEILFFWVARMIIAGYEYEDELPFKNVYLTGIVRDKLGRKMSKSLGNSPDPLDLIKLYGADAVRLGMLFTSPAGNDLPYDDSLCEQGRNFNNKIWNAFRLVKGWEVKEIKQPQYAKSAINNFEKILNRAIISIEKSYSKYRLSEALMTVYKLFWDDFSSKYLENIKPEYQHPIDTETYNKTIEFFDTLLKLLHPFIPFITEELWHALISRGDDETIMIQTFPVSKAMQPKLTNYNNTEKLISSTKKIIKDHNLSPNTQIKAVEFVGSDKLVIKSILQKRLRVKSIITVKTPSENSILAISGATACYINIGITINKQAEIEKLEKELEYEEGFLLIVMKKLGNEKFVANAKPEVVNAERNKQSDTESKIASLKEAIAGLKK